MFLEPVSENKLLNSFLRTMKLPREADHPTISSVDVVTEFSKSKIKTYSLTCTKEQRNKCCEAEISL